MGVVSWRLPTSSSSLMWVCGLDGVGSVFAARVLHFFVRQAKGTPGTSWRRRSASRSWLLGVLTELVWAGSVFLRLRLYAAAREEEAGMRECGRKG